MNQNESSPDLQHDRFPLSEIEQSISRRFEEIRIMFPDNIAVCTPHCRLTYFELDKLSNIYANTLIAKGVQTGDRVCFLTEQGHHQIAVIMAILKARAIYVPLQPRSSRQHLISVLEDAGPVFLLCDSRNEALSQLLSQLWIQANFQIINISELTESRLKNFLPLEGGPDDLAYIYYTSGSTGKPKGVVDSHRNVLHNVRRYSNSLEIEAHDKLTLLQSCEFSGAVSNIFTALLNGATLLVVEPKTSGMQYLAHWLAREKATIYHSVPGIFRELVRTGVRFPALRIIRLEGDRAILKDIQSFQRHFHSSCRLLHGLGSTETGIVAQYAFLNEAENNYTNLPLGYPTMETSVQITDLQSRLPIETGIGEITVTSRFLAVGYWRQQELTDQRFKFSGNRRTYFTGDLGRLSTDGKLFFVGRKSDSDAENHIIKDAAWIETEIGALAGIELCVALPGKNNKKIDIYVQVSDSTKPDDLANLLGEESPKNFTSAYRLQFIIVDAIPFNAFGKTDLQALQNTDWQSDKYKATRSNTEIVVTNAFKQTLGLGYLGANANFFEMGGTSLSAMEVVSNLSSHYPFELVMGAFLHMPTPASIANILDGKCELESIVALQPVGDNKPFICIHAHMGHLYNLRQLADRFAPDTPFFGVQMMNSGELPPPSITLMATRYQKLISRHLPFENYSLAGYCFGSWVAVEMARQKIERDEDPGTLVLIDPDLPVTIPKQRTRSPFTLLKQIFDKPLNRVIGNLGNKCQSGTRIVRDQLWILADRTGLSSSTLKTSPEYICCIAAHNYSPRPYPGRVHLFLPDNNYSQEIHDEWNTMFPGEMQITTIAASPRELLREPAARQLGDAILLHLARDRLTTRKDF